MFKNIILVFLLSLFFIGCSFNELERGEFEREKVSKQLLDDIGYVLFLLKKDDLETLNNYYINQTYGVYTVYKNDFDNKIIFKKDTKIDEIINIVDSFDIKQEPVTFNCSPNNDAYYGWDKDGTFISTNTKPYLSQLMTDANIYKEDELKRVAIIEKTSYEVIVTNNSVFYMTKIDGKWYITLIDNITTDCSK